jgi:hypothetical protein
MNHADFGLIHGLPRLAVHERFILPGGVEFGGRFFSGGASQNSFAVRIIEDPVTLFDGVAVTISRIESGGGPIGIASAGVSAHSFFVVGCGYTARTGNRRGMEFESAIAEDNHLAIGVGQKTGAFQPVAF